ncbi:uncharacterized protein LOC135092942 isoform X3 [Scylla paramamosain]|uniref:uncharacterized protein LOC135092942 isoform X3 n=1 Tax=Scylla paramamosain TaxID=85552 RepID=UPI00308337C1
MYSFNKELFVRSGGRLVFLETVTTAVVAARGDHDKEAKQASAYHHDKEEAMDSHYFKPVFLCDVWRRWVHVCGRGAPAERDGG